MWVKTQRKAHKVGKMPDNRRQRLEAIGFEWTVGGTTSSMLQNDLWEQRYQELIDFKREHGHCKVPRSAGSLGRWVSRQRDVFREGNFLDDRKERLEAIGFAWSGQGQEGGEEEGGDFDEWIETNSEDVYDDESDETGYSSDESEDGSDDANDVDGSELIEVVGADSDDTDSGGGSKVAMDHVSALGARWMERFNELEDFKVSAGCPSH